jgi:hypothetical protein
VNPRVTEVRPSDDYTLILTFDNGEVGIFDVSPYLNMGLFRHLRDRSVFNSVRPFLGSIQWNNGLDLCPDTLYLDSKRLVDGLTDDQRASARHQGRS